MWRRSFTSAWTYGVMLVIFFALRDPRQSFLENGADFLAVVLVVGLVYRVGRKFLDR